MRLLYSMSATVLLAVLTLAACNSSDNSGNKANVSGNNSAATVASATPNRAASSDGIKRITTVETRDAVEKGEALIVDVRGDAAYKQNHIKGSISIPLGDVAARINELPRDKMIVTYCSWPAEQTSARAAQTMKEKGIENVAALLGGTAAWQNAGLPMEAGQ